MAFLVVRLIVIGWIDGNQLGNLGSMMGTDRVSPHHLIGVDWAQNLRGTNHNRLHPTILKHIFCLSEQKEDQHHQQVAQLSV